MRYRTKLYLALIGISFISSFLAISISYYETKQQFLQEYSSKVLSIAATTAAFLDGDAIEKIRSKKDESLPEYAKIQAELRKARDVNRRKDVYVKWLYTYYPSKENREVFYYGVDPEESSRDHAAPGDVYDEAEMYKLSVHYRQNYMPEKFIRDPTGEWLMASVPIRDSAGNVIGGLEADIRANDVVEVLNKLLMFGLWAFGISFVVAISIGFVLARKVTQSLASLDACVKKISGGDLGARVFLTTHDEFHSLGLAINEMAKGLQERERLKTGFARYVSQHVLDKILSSESSLKLEGERRKVTVLFSDIRHFTTLSETLLPEQVVLILNEYFKQMIEIIFRNRGTLDKFLGDGIMVEFGAPLEDPQQETHAVTAALEMQHEVGRLSADWEKMGRPRFEVGIGIHTGFAVVGNVGSEQRIEYTAIGDTVNIASRLEFATKELKTPILVSEETFQALPQGMFKFKNLGPIQVHGREKPIHAYAILPFD